MFLLLSGQFRPHSEVQVYHRVLYWDPFCFCFILMTSHQSLFHRLGYLLMIASYIAPSALVQTLRLCKGTGILWSDGVVHGTWSSIQKMSNYVHHQSQWEVTSYLSVQLMWSCIVQCSDSQVSWDHSGLSWSSHVHSIHSRANSTLGFLRRNLQCCPAKLEETAYITLVRSTLEYAASTWDPHLAKKLQRRSARFVKGDYRTTSNVSQMLHDLGRYDLKDRWRDLKIGLALQHCHWAVPSLGMWPLIQIRLVWELRTTGLEQIIDTNSGQLQT